MTKYEEQIRGMAQQNRGSVGMQEARPQRKPLTDDELSDIWFKQSTDWMEFARAIEAAHGIKENT